MFKILLLLFTLLFSSISVRAETFALYDFSNNKLTAYTEINQVVSIASITKLFTAMAIIEQQLDLNEKVRVQSRVSGRIPNGSLVTRADLLKAMLISSDNRAAEALANSFPGGHQGFLEFINLYVQRLGLMNTTIADSSGLLSDNKSTAKDLIFLIEHLKKFPLIMETSSKTKEILDVELNSKKKIKLEIKNTNPDIDRYKTLISKTGYTSRAGRCILLLLENNNIHYGLVILGEKTIKTRSNTIRQLMNL